MDVLPGSSIVISLGEHPTRPDDKPFISSTVILPVEKKLTSLSYRHKSYIPLKEKMAIEIDTS